MKTDSKPSPQLSKMNVRERMYTIIFESDTKQGKRFDIVLLFFIVVSIIIVILESMHVFSTQNATFLFISEWIITLFFTIEYILRIYSAPKRKVYVFSFFGIIDLLSTLPLYISFFFGGAIYLSIIRVFRLIRIFRVFRMFSFISEGNALMLALKESSRKVLVFFLFVVLLTITIGTIMFMIESEYNNPGFDNILNSIYWSIVTLTTVGYGDITPITGLGRFLSAVVMLLGYTIIAVPTGIVSASMITSAKKNAKVCTHCNKINDADAAFCKFCGKEIEKLLKP